MVHGFRTEGHELVTLSGADLSIAKTLSASK